MGVPSRTSTARSSRPMLTFIMTALLAGVREEGGRRRGPPARRGARRRSARCAVARGLRRRRGGSERRRWVASRARGLATTATGFESLQARRDVVGRELDRAIADDDL